MDTFAKLFDFALAKEDEAAAFYELLASTAAHGSLRNFFLELAGEERAHRAAFERIVREHGSGTPDRGNRPANLLLSDYLVEVAYSPSMSFQDALILAMKREEKSLRLYTDLAGAADSAEVSATLRSLADQEAAHKTRLEKIYDRDVLTED
jgi:rubrerythrin